MLNIGQDSNHVIDALGVYVIKSFYMFDILRAQVLKLSRPKLKGDHDHAQQQLWGAERPQKSPQAL